MAKAVSTPQPVATPAAPVADLETLQREIRTLHNRYLNEKSCTAYLDEALTYLLNHEAEFAKLASQKAQVQREIADLTGQLNGMQGELDAKKAAAYATHHAALATYQAEIRDVVQALEQQKTSSALYVASLKRTEQEHELQLQKVQALITAAHEEKTQVTSQLDAQASSLRAKIDALRKEFASL